MTAFFIHILDACESTAILVDVGQVDEVTACVVGDEAKTTDITMDAATGTVGTSDLDSTVGTDDLDADLDCD